jgi:hypothetical protein
LRCQLTAYKTLLEILSIDDVAQLSDFAKPTELLPTVGLSEAEEHEIATLKSEQKTASAQQSQGTWENWDALFSTSEASPLAVPTQIPPKRPSKRALEKLPPQPGSTGKKGSEKGKQSKKRSKR